MFAAIRFIWNATRGYRLTPWKSPYFRWRVETYTSKRAETLDAKEILHFVWQSRWELIRYLLWTGEIDREARKKA